jgi:hypothetical protein
MSNDSRDERPQLSLVADTGTIKAVREAILDLIDACIQSGRLYLDIERRLGAEGLALYISEFGSDVEHVQSVTELARDEELCALAAARAHWPGAWPDGKRAKVSRAMDAPCPLVERMVSLDKPSEAS